MCYVSDRCVGMLVRFVGGPYSKMCHCGLEVCWCALYKVSQKYLTIFEMK
jgi:hypothetical protein